jgi:Rad3-related DNA helicase
MDLEEIGLKGRLEKFCPFFYERHSRPVANVVLVPYNYLFDRKVWASEEGVRLDGAVLVLDEAHNIQGACEQFREYSINLSTLARAIQQADELRFQKLN